MIRHRLEYIGVRTLITAVRFMPPALVDACGSALGMTFYVLDRQHRRVAERNVAAAFPTRTVAEHTVIVRGAFRHFGRLLFELLKFSTLTDAQMLARVEFEGEERVRSAYAQGRGVLFVTGHFGYWELQAIAHPFYSPTIAVMARPLDNPRLHALLERLRTMTGNRVLYRQGVLRRVLRELTANHGVAILIDQHIHTSEAVYVDYFGRPAATTSALAPGYCPETLIVGGAISGYCATGRRENETAPRITMMIDTTAAKIGLSMKKCEIRMAVLPIILPRRWACRRRLPPASP